MKKSACRICSFIILATLVFIGASYYAIFGTGHISRWFEPDPVKIEIVKGMRESFKLKIRHNCVYEVGVYFKSKKTGEAGRSHTKNTFRDHHATTWQSKNLPVKFNITITDADSNVVFSREGFGGVTSGGFDGYEIWVQGRSRFIVGMVRLSGYLLSAREYEAIIKVDEVYRDLSDFNSYFSVSLDRKSYCRTYL